jgi:hypothetical protein
MVGYCRLTDHQAARWLFGAASLFTFSLLLRSLDNALCADWPSGLHFGWHLLNDAVLYLAVRCLLVTSASSGHAVHFTELDACSLFVFVE